MHLTPFLLERRGVKPPTKFLKRGLTGSQFLEGLLEKGGDICQGGLPFSHKNKLKSENLMTKNVYKQNCFSLSEQRI